MAYGGLLDLGTAQQMYTYGGHSRISDNDFLKQILYHFCASHIPTNKLQHVCYSELLSNNCHDATSMVARQQKIAG